MGEFEPTSEIANRVMPIKIGDVFLDRRQWGKPFPLGRAWVADLLPADNPTRVVLEFPDGSRKTLPIADVRRLYVFRSAQA